jgi:hypothetical protein
MASINGIHVDPFQSFPSFQGSYGFFGLNTRMGYEFAPPNVFDGGFPTDQIFSRLPSWGLSLSFDGSAFGNNWVKFGDYMNEQGNMYFDLTFAGGEVWLRSVINQVFRIGWLNIEPYQGIAQFGVTSSSFIGYNQFAANGPAFYISSDMIVFNADSFFLRVVDENGSNYNILLQ